MAKWLEKIGVSRSLVKSKARYFSHALLTLSIREAVGLGTFATSATGIMSVDPACVLSWTEEENAGAVCHEMLHVVLAHHKRGVNIARCFNLSHEETNITLDLAINTIVRGMGFPLPTGALFPSDYGWPEDLTAEEYAERMAARKKQGQPSRPNGQSKPGQGKPGQGAGKPAKPGQRPATGQAAGQGEPTPGVGSGRCGTCAGNHVPGQADDGDKDARSEGDLERLRQRTAEAIREAASKGCGTVPGGLIRWADATLRPSKIRWQDKLRAAIRAAVAYTAGQVDLRYDAPGKRQAGIGYGPGRAVLPRLQSPVPRVAFALDTSGSMSGQDLTDALSECAAILKAIPGRVTFISCDADVHALGKIDRIAQAGPLVKGGGGTDFRPVFDRLARERDRPHVLVFATDGCGPAPEVEPKWCRVIWLIIGRNAMIPYGGDTATPVTWGTVIRVDPEEKTQAA